MLAALPCKLWGCCIINVMRTKAVEEFPTQENEYQGYISRWLWFQGLGVHRFIASDIHKPTVILYCALVLAADGDWCGPVWVCHMHGWLLSAKTNVFQWNIHLPFPDVFFVFLAEHCSAQRQHRNLCLSGITSGEKSPTLHLHHEEEMYITFDSFTFCLS